ncbi:MAG TPA: glycosyltransferase [Opitutaceae bacterium]|nr:glycosyltransferase [Opitutaceae bacterium]
MSAILVVTPTLGESRWLDETVASVAAQSVACRHVLVAPAARMTELARRFSRVEVIAESGGGMYAAINAGLAAAGEWDAFTYLNDDDALLPRFGVVAQALAARRGEPAIAYGGVRLIDARGARIGAIPISPFPRLNRALYAQRIEPVYQHGTLVTRAAFAQLGGFDTTFRYCGDSEFLARACVRSVRFVCATTREVAAFRVRAGQLTKNRAALVEERRRVDEKLGLLAPMSVAQRLAARLVFRVANFPRYVERIARHGFVSFDELLTRIE